MLFPRYENPTAAEIILSDQHLLPHTPAAVGGMSASIPPHTLSSDLPSGLQPWYIGRSRIEKESIPSHLSRGAWPSAVKWGNPSSYV